ncbi:hypothetical protein [Klebsiella pneumoniae]|uniref:hypothetical protein n=1 Tax=Klebsiella pneumoniae TaxID=573 RepID=UPI00217E5D90|nr:hypothetical protein [Klebsiella pneumoniae]MCS6647264.1 hypothetical protein [Klebsiella pneumoniae subsp. pneumoniae]HCF8344349.1 hypothetical protein [Klebsiella pneumoniae]
MTSKLTREENVQAVFDLKAGYTLGLADVEILKRVARMALAAMDSEPVSNAQLPISRERLEQIHWAAKSLGNYCRADEIEALAAFALSVIDAQPAPVVPPMQHWEELCRQYPDMSIRDAIIRAAWWNHCRAAMLQAGNSPVIPAGYVIVPKEPTAEMIWAAKYVMSSTVGWASFKAVYIAMLAAAPQEVKDVKAN